MWIDTHCHLDASEFEAPNTGRQWVRELARQRGVTWCVYPAVAAGNWQAVRQLAHEYGDVYALGIHPLYVPQASTSDLNDLAQALEQHQHDPRLVAVGEIGLDFFVPALCTPVARERQLHFYNAQLKLAQRFGLPVILHVRRSADELLKPLRAMARQGRPVQGGIAHAFNGSLQQAHAFVQLGFKLGFGGAVTFDTALQLNRLARALPPEAVVMETDSPDIPPQWLYVNAEQRAAGAPQGINTPAELPAIGTCVAQARGLTAESWARQTTQNAFNALPRLRAIADNPPP
jgi:TatD DNase family protein